ncbi:MAG: NUDIX hydrolase [Planctomycetaceae bacterium]|nr:NUDIX hydrolase [Planctomycetaceae bacterium]
MSKHILQAGTIPYRKLDDNFEFCVIETSSGKWWGFPKGVIDPGETPEETAIKESYEEAGLRGELDGTPLGTFQYSKWRSKLDCTVYLMDVQYEDGSWPESSRERRWVDFDTARKMIHRVGFQHLLEAAFRRLTR